MRIIPVIFALFLIVALTGFKQNIKPEQIAVLELFTSEGCSSCPPADELLGNTINEYSGSRKVYALAFHVDYWNRLGWKDSFSTKQFTERQQTYVSRLQLDGAYTPQLIINGTKDIVGSDRAALNRMLKTAFETTASATFTSLKITSSDNAPIQLHYELGGDYKNCDIHFALVSKHEATAVKRGENGGRTLKHANVVRQFITANADNSGDIKFETYPIPAKANMTVIAFVQRKGDGKIIGATEVK